MDEKKILPNNQTLGVMMQHFAQRGNISKMLEFFEQIPEKQRDSHIDAILIDG
jgi:pentatricopeptide repeat protein